MFDIIVGTSSLSTNGKALAEGVMTKELEGTLADLAKVIHPHPTLSKTVMKASHLPLGSSIHILRQ